METSKSGSATLHPELDRIVDKEGKVRTTRLGAAIEYLNKSNLPYDVVIVPKYILEVLRSDQAKLNALEAAGVDNWPGYGEAMSALEDEEEEEVDDE